MRIRSILLLLISLAVVAVGCGEQPTTIIAGDDTTDASADEAMSEDDSGSVADESAPVEVGPTTTVAPTTPPATAPWEDTLKEYPLLTILDDQQNASIGSARFVLVDDSGNPILSGSDDLPLFIVKIDAWFGTDNYIEHTITTFYAELLDGEVVNSTRCGRDFSHFSKIGKDQYLRVRNQLPELKNTNLAWEDDGCADRLPANYDSLFEGPVNLGVTDNGFWVSTETSKPSRFMKLAPVNPQPETTTTIAVATTEAQRTTTTAEAASE